MMGNTHLVFIFSVSAFLCVFSKSITDSVIIPCKKDDDVCMTKSANIIIPLIAAGMPELKVESIDPVNPGNMEGELPNLIYKLKDNLIHGYGKCVIANVKLNLDSMTLNFGLNCPSLVLEGQYEISGEVMNGKGTYKLVMGKYYYEIKADIEKVTSGNGENHMSIKTFGVSGQRLEPVKIDYKDIDENQKPATKEEAEMERKKLMKVAELIKHAYILATFNAIFKNVNVLLQTVPFDDLFIH